MLIVTGGCCHDYEFQSAAMIEGIPKHAKVDFTLVNEGGKGTDAQIALYDDPKWAKPYDVVIHNECLANTADETYIRKITDAHKSGTPVWWCIARCTPTVLQKLTTGASSSGSRARSTSIRANTRSRS